MGCRNVTEKGLYYLLSSNSNLKTVNVIGTDVGIIPANIKGSVINRADMGQGLIWCTI